MKIEVKKGGLSLGILFALTHLANVLLISSFGKAYPEFLGKIHFLSDSVAVLPFNISTAVAGVALAFVIGGVLGSLFAFIWNKLN